MTQFHHAFRTSAFDVTVTPTVTNGIYAAGDIMGGLMTFPVSKWEGAPVFISGVQVVIKAAVAPNLRLILFNADPTATTKTDNAAYSLNAADAFKLIRAIALPASGLTDHGTPNSYESDAVNCVVQLASTSINVYGLLIDDLGVTLTSTSDVQVRLRGEAS